MTQTDTPRTDAIYYSSHTDYEMAKAFSGLARRLELALAKANADKAVLIAACKAALSLAWEVGCETEDGVHTLLDDERGDLYRQLSATLSQVQA